MDRAGFPCTGRSRGLAGGLEPSQIESYLARPSQFTGLQARCVRASRNSFTVKSHSESMEMLPPAPSVGEVPDDETTQTTALIAQVPRIALEELARRMLENPGSVSRADFEAALAGHGRRTTKTRMARSATSAASTPRSRPRTPSTRLFGARASKGSGARTRSSTGNWCRARRTTVAVANAAAKSPPPPRRRRAHSGRAERSATRKTQTSTFEVAVYDSN